MLESVAVVIHVYKKELTEYEKISFIQACRILNQYRFILVSYRELDISKYINILDDEEIAYKIKYFNSRYFISTDGYNSLLLSTHFYLKFLLYKYILIYQFDCFVFRDELDAWVAMNYSYIGAPWLEDYNVGKYGDTVRGVGNGGFSLRHVMDHFKSLIIYNYTKKRDLLREFMNASNRSKARSRAFLQLLKKLILQNAFVITNWRPNEDYFWGEIARNNYSWFKIPEWEVASRFSIEVQPEYFYELNNNELPFGCHAWWTYDLKFWKPFIEKFGYNLN